MAQRGALEKHREVGAGEAQGRAPEQRGRSSFNYLPMLYFSLFVGKAVEALQVVGGRAEERSLHHIRRCIVRTT